MARFDWLLKRPQRKQVVQAWPDVHPLISELKLDARPERISKDEIGALAQEIDVPRANMLALIRQESSNSGFQLHEDNYWRPVVRLELHQLNRRTDGMFHKERPDLFKARFNIKDGNVPQAVHYSRMNEALLIAEALFGAEPIFASTSWGLCQVMGFNFRPAGSGTIERFIHRMATSEREQVKAAITFIDSHPAMRRALANRDWETFALHYNGSARAKRYAQELAQNFHVVSGRRI